VLFFVQLPGGETMDIGTAVLAALPALLITLPEVTAEQDSALAVALVTLVVAPMIALLGRLIGRLDKVSASIDAMRESNTRLVLALDQATRHSEAMLAATEQTSDTLAGIIQRMDRLEQISIFRGEAN